MKPYKVKKDLWFYPVLSQNVPSFNGFYFQYPALTFPDEGFNPADIGEDSPYYGFVNSTVFCFGEEETGKYIQAGFNHVVNVEAFKNDYWTMNDTVFGVKLQVVPQGWESQLGYVFSLSYNGDDYFENLSYAPLSPGVGMVIFAPSVPMYTDGEIEKYYVHRRVIRTGENGYFTNIINTQYYPINSDKYILLWKDVVETPSEAPKGTRIYKNIILMNGAKIVKEENTEAALTDVTSAMPYMDGVIGYFVPETQDLSNQLWADMTGGSSITLNGAIQSGKAIGLRENPHSWGQLYIEEPIIIYIIVKYENSTLIDKTAAPPVLTKGVYNQNQQGYYAFNVRGNEKLEFWAASGNNDALINNSDTTSFHVMCIAKTGDNSKILTYLDGNYVSSTPNPAKMGSYKGFYMLNNISHWTTPGIDYPWNFDYMMLAFGTQTHSAEQIKANSDWLYKKYISEEPMPDLPKGVRVYKDIVLMNGAKIYNEDGTEYFS